MKFDYKDQLDYLSDIREGKSKSHKDSRISVAWWCPKTLVHLPINAGDDFLTSSVPFVNTGFSISQLIEIGSVCCTEIFIALNVQLQGGHAVQ